jgi:hypothetical protein
MSSKTARPARCIVALRFFVAFLVLGSLPAYGVAFAQQAGTPGLNNWQSLAGGQAAEWVFQYTGSSNPALVAFGADPNGAIAVNVYDDGQWRALMAGDTSVQPVGRGTSGTMGGWSSNQDLISNGNLFWEAKARPGVTFHIQVINNSQTAARYWIAAAGSGAGSLTLASPAAGPTAAPTAQPSGGSQTSGSQTSGQTANAATSGAGTPSATGNPPQQLPVSGAGPFAVPAAGLALSAAGWLARRHAI